MAKKNDMKPRRKPRSRQWGPRPNKFTCKRCKRTFWTRKAQDEHMEKECGELQAKRWKRSTIGRFRTRRRHAYETPDERAERLFAAHCLGHLRPRLMGRRDHLIHKCTKCDKELPTS